VHTDVGAADLAGWAQIFDLDHDPARLAELAPEVSRLRASIRRLWDFDVDGHEMPIGFRPEDHGRDR
jgi:hypothetical protein